MRISYSKVEARDGESLDFRKSGGVQWKSARVARREIFHPLEKDCYDFSVDDLSGGESTQWNQVNHPFLKSSGMTRQSHARRYSHWGILNGEKNTLLRDSCIGDADVDADTTVNEQQIDFRGCVVPG
ncbi:hypothetical protein KQX54_008542 [Cotesia glomerata]|uniref:Uncharacterized protein n=1 Tax=Cotesia glomerata TaxID=32391 RepID=A0AAV7IMZ6_COTGL|nr:hypothetical protein KQX54_008542 [Cotesia glomerata]